MLRLPPFSYLRMESAAEAVRARADLGDTAMYIAGGTDLIPNMKHRLFEPKALIALRSLPELSGIRIEGGELVIGAGETLTRVSSNPKVRQHFPALADAAGHIAGPQLRNAGTIGGNLCLDTRCTYYNQTEFWRDALGYCLKKDGDVCHVTKVGKKCVAAHSADTPPVLMTLGAKADLIGPDGERSVHVRDFFIADGIWNSVRQPDEIVTRVRIPLPAKGFRASYTKLRQRRSIDFPLLTVAVGAQVDEEGRLESVQGVVTALGSRPRELTGWDSVAVGRRLDADVIEALAERAHKQSHPLENIIVDPDWRRAMVPVHIRRALTELMAAG